MNVYCKQKQLNKLRDRALFQFAAKKKKFKESVAYCFHFLESVNQAAFKRLK